MEKTIELSEKDKGMLRREIGTMVSNARRSGKIGDIELFPFAYSPRHEFSNGETSMSDCPSNCIFWDVWKNFPTSPKQKDNNEPLLLRDIIKVREDTPEYGFVRNEINDVVFLATKKAITELQKLLDVSVSVLSIERKDIMKALRV